MNHDPELMHNRLQYTEKFLQKVSSNLEKIVQKEASLRDHHDQLVEDIIEFTNFERINLTMRVNLEEFAKQLSTIQDYRDALVTNQSSSPSISEILFFSIDFRSRESNIKYYNP